MSPIWHLKDQLPVPNVANVGPRVQKHSRRMTPILLAPYPSGLIPGSLTVNITIFGIYLRKHDLKDENLQA